VIPPRLFHTPSMEVSSVVSILYLNPDHPIARAIYEPAIIDGKGAAHWSEILDHVGSARPCPVAGSDTAHGEFILRVIETRLERAPDGGRF